MAARGSAIYATAMVSPIYEQYLTIVRAIADELPTCARTTIS